MPATADTFDWVRAATFNWNLNESWTPSERFPNEAGDIANLHNSNAAANVTLGEDITIGTLSWQSGGGHALTLNAGDILTFDSGDPDEPAVFTHRRGTNGRGFQLNLNSGLHLASALDLEILSERSHQITGAITGNGVLGVTIDNINSQENARRLVFGGVAPNTHTGGTSIHSANNTNSGQVHIRLDKAGAFGSGPLSLSGSYDLNLNGRNITIGGLSGSISGLSNPAWFPSGIRNGAAGTIRTLTIQLPDGASPDYSGVIHGTVARNDSPSILSGNLNLVIEASIGSGGTGIQTLSAENTYSGTTIIRSGTLALSDIGSIASSPLIEVHTGAVLDVTERPLWTVAPTQTLTGTGSLTGDASIAGILAPGFPYGGFSASGNVTFTNTSILHLDLNPEGTRQVETATAPSPSLEDGKVIVTVTGEGIAGSPLAFEIDVELFELQENWAAKVRDALGSSAAITALYAVGGSEASITLTRLAAAADDPTLNIAIDNGDPSPDIDPAPLSANTTLGSAPGADLLAVGGELVIDGATLDLNIAGTPDAPAYVIATYASRTGTFATVNGLPTGYSLNYNYNGGTAIALVEGGAPPLSPFEEWIAGFSVGGQTAAGDDPDGDGAPNFMEFALDSDPSDSSSQAKVFVKLATVDATADVLTLTAAVRSSATFAADGNNQKAVAGADQLTYHVEAAATLDDWGSQAVTMVTGADAAAIQAGLPDPSAGWSYRTFRTSGSALGDPRKFIRLRVTTP